MPSKPDRSLVSRVFLCGLSFFFIWTVGVHIVALNGLPFDYLHAVFALALLLAGASLLWRIDPLDTPALALPRLRVAGIDLRTLTLVDYMLIGASALLFAACLGMQYKMSSFTPLWTAYVVLGGLAIWLRGRFKNVIHLNRVAAEATRHTSPALVFGLAALVGIVFYLFTSVPDTDDSLFLNLAIGAKESRGAVFAEDTMLGLDGLPFIKSTYRLESYQLLTAILSDLTGASVLFTAHTVVPLLTFLWIVSVLIVVHRQLFPQHFAITLLFHGLLLVALDGAIQSFGYHALPRFFHGKAPFVTGMIPLIAILTWYTLRTGSAFGYVTLAMSMVVALGFTANALYCAALCVALLGLTFLVFGGRARWRALWLAGVVLYPAALAVYLLLFDPPSGSQFNEAGTIGGALWGITGSPMALVISLCVVAGLIFLPLVNAAAAPIAFYIMSFFALIVNPVTWPVYGEFVTGYVNTRLFWSVPVVLAFTMILGVIWISSRWILRTGLLLALAGGLVWPGSILHRADFGLAFTKVNEENFLIASRIVETLDPEALVLAPEKISAWITVLENAPHVVEGRAIYTPQRFGGAFDEALEMRQQMYTFWDTSHLTNLAEARFASLMTSANVTAILVDTRYTHHMNTLSLIEREGFSVAWTDSTFQLFVRR